MHPLCMGIPRIILHKVSIRPRRSNINPQVYSCISKPEVPNETSEGNMVFEVSPRIFSLGPTAGHCPMLKKEPQSERQAVR